MIALLFSFKGRIGRLKFFLTSGAVGLVTIICLWPLLVKPIVDAVYLHRYALETSMIDITYADIEKSFFVIAAAAWMQLSLVWKRTRDMNQDMTLAYFYVVFLVLSLIPVIGYIFLSINCLFAFLLLFKPSKDNARRVNPEIFGSRSGNDEDYGELSSDFASQLTDADLVARAAQLREQQPRAKPVPQNKPSQNTPLAAAKSFGRRSGLQPS